nr:helix-turn-helix domain-containing protein [uncultured Flavobacterium sp.]
MNDLDIIRIRKGLGMTQLEFAEFLGADRRTIINYEQGKKIPASRIKLLKVLLANINHKEVVTEPKDVRLPRTNDVSIETSENLHREISDLKDHIKTLKDFLEEKNKLAEMYMNENKFLKEKLLKHQIE